VSDVVSLEGGAEWAGSQEEPGKGCEGSGYLPLNPTTAIDGIRTRNLIADVQIGKGAGLRVIAPRVREYMWSEYHARQRSAIDMDGGRGARSL
jgi:hypothetical protein